MAGITKGAIGNLLFSPKSSNHSLVGVFDILVTRKCGESHHRRRRPQHQHYQHRSLLVSTTNGSCNTNTFANPFPTIKGNDQPSFSGSIIFHGHPASIFLTMSNNITRTDRRSIHSETTAESSSQPAETNDSSVQHLERRPKSDPTAKRPTPKCDPYGLQGESLSYAQCLDWMSTLEDGWMLRRQSEKDDTVVDTVVEENTNDATAIERTAPKFLQKYHYHSTFHEASQFLSQISLLATNINHFPFLSMERLLVNDLNNIHDNCSVDGKSIVSEKNINNGGSTTTNRKKRKIKGWIFRSTIRCSTYRPPTAGSSTSRLAFQKDEKMELHRDKGLTYHDFHLAMMIDVEVNREEVKRLLWSDDDLQD